LEKFGAELEGGLLGGGGLLGELVAKASVRVGLGWRSAIRKQIVNKKSGKEKRLLYDRRAGSDTMKQVVNN